MRDFRNAKAMAKTLREDLAERSFPVSHSDSLELISHVLGAKNWQTLSAAIEADAAHPALAEPAVSPPQPATATRLPLLPMRDIVVFPEMTLPLFAQRPKTLRAIERAMAGDRRIFLVAQRTESEDPPKAEDLFEVGVTAVILQSLRLPDGPMKVTVQGVRRARLSAVHDGELLEAEIEPIDAPAPDEAAKDLARQAMERFSVFANFDPASPPVAMARVGHMAAHPGSFADLITPHIATRLNQTQDLLETIDPAERLRKLMALMSAGRKAA